MKINAHIPTQTYGYIEIQDLPDDPKVVQDMYNKYAEKPIQLTQTIGGKRVEAFVGGFINYDDISHTYTNDQGDVYLSGSKYASSFEKPFDSQMIAGKVAQKAGIDTDLVLQMWEMKRDISNGFGTAIHLAMELYGKYNHLADAVGKDYSLHDHPIIKRAVESFYASHPNAALYEPMVVDHKRKLAGQIDRLSGSDTDGYYVEDFKTNAVLDKAKLDGYWKQLSFYASILEAGGKTVNGLRIYHWNGGEWTTHEHAVEEITL